VVTRQALHEAGLVEKKLAWGACKFHTAQPTSTYTECPDYDGDLEKSYGPLHSSSRSRTPRSLQGAKCARHGWQNQRPHTEVQVRRDSEFQALGTRVSQQISARSTDRSPSRRGLPKQATTPRSSGKTYPGEVMTLLSIPSQTANQAGLVGKGVRRSGSPGSRRSRGTRDGRRRGPLLPA